LLGTVHQLERAKIWLTRRRVGQPLEDRVNGLRVERDDATVPFAEDTRNFPPDAEIQGQLRIELPGIINEVGLIARAGVRPARRLVRPSGRDAQEERRERIPGGARVGSVKRRRRVAERERASRRVVLEIGFPGPQEIAAELERVTA